jgi:hypothetical protein
VRGTAKNQIAPKAVLALGFFQCIQDRGHLGKARLHKISHFRESTPATAMDGGSAEREAVSE